MDLPTRLGVGANMQHLSTHVSGHDAFAIIYSNSSVWGGGGGVALCQTNYCHRILLISDTHKSWLVKVRSICSCWVQQDSLDQNGGIRIKHGVKMSTW